MKHPPSPAPRKRAYKPRVSREKRRAQIEAMQRYMAFCGHPVVPLCEVCGSSDGVVQQGDQSLCARHSDTARKKVISDFISALRQDQKRSEEREARTPARRAVVDQKKE